MQLQFGLCSFCVELLQPYSRIRIAPIAKIHQYLPLSAKARAALREKAEGKNFPVNNAETPKGKKRVLRISCKRPEYNHYAEQSYGKFDNIPLASKGWHHRKSRGDFFAIHRYRENPALSQSAEVSRSFDDIGISNNVINILEKQEIIKPTVIQADGIPAILGGHNTLLTAETGCGKTLAYLLPLVEQIMKWQLLMNDRPPNSPFGVVVIPNRELASQIGEVAQKISSELMFTTQVLIGGHTKRKMLNPKYEHVDLLVATLGALSKLTTTGIYNMKNVYHVVLDEADTLLDDSFNEKLCHFLKRFPFQFKGDATTRSLIPRGVQLTLVSATMPTSLPDILGDVVNTDSFVRITSSRVHRLMAHVPQKFYRFGRSQKPAQLLTMVKRDVANKHPTIIFSNKSSTCDWISMFLNENGVPCVNLNGDMLLDVRTGKMDSFQSGEVNVISCTDIGSRGIDTVRVKHVINYDFPLYMADYIHRCGRTGRVGSVEGCHVSNFVAGSEEVELVQKIEMAARRMDALPNVNANISRTIKCRTLKRLEEEAMSKM